MNNPEIAPSATSSTCSSVLDSPSNLLAAAKAAVADRNSLVAAAAAATAPPPRRSPDVVMTRPQNDLEQRFFFLQPYVHPSSQKFNTPIFKYHFEVNIHGWVVQKTVSDREVYPKVPDEIIEEVVNTYFYVVNRTDRAAGGVDIIYFDEKGLPVELHKGQFRDLLEPFNFKIKASKKAEYPIVKFIADSWLQNIRRNTIENFIFDPSQEPGMKTWTSDQLYRFSKKRRSLYLDANVNSQGVTTYSDPNTFASFNRWEGLPYFMSDIDEWVEVANSTDHVRCRLFSYIEDFISIPLRFRKRFLGPDPIVNADYDRWIRHDKEPQYTPKKLMIDTSIFCDPLDFISQSPPPEAIRKVPIGNDDSSAYFSVSEVFCRIVRYALFFRIFTVLCKENATEYLYVMNWMGWKLLHPGSPPGVALTITGVQGTGKSSFFEYVFLRIFGSANYAIVPNGTDLATKFGSALYQDKIICLCEEVKFDHSMALLLKNRITALEITNEKKNVNIKAVPNRLGYIFISNDTNCIPLEHNNINRRYYLQESDPEYGTPEKIITYHTPFIKLFEGNNYAIQVLTHYYLTWADNMDPNFHPINNRPMTNLMKTNIAESAFHTNPVVYWWKEGVKSGQWHTTETVALKDGTTKKSASYNAAHKNTYSLLIPEEDRWTPEQWEAHPEFPNGHWYCVNVLLADIYNQFQDWRRVYQMARSTTISKEQFLKTLANFWNYQLQTGIIPKSLDLPCLPDAKQLSEKFS